LKTINIKLSIVIPELLHVTYNLELKTHNISEARSASLYKWDGGKGVPTVVELMGTANLSLCTQNKF